MIAHLVAFLMGQQMAQHGQVWTMDPLTLGYWSAHGLSVTAIFTTLVGWAPPIAATAAFIWYVLQIADMPQVKNWIIRRRLRKIKELQRRLEDLQAKNAQTLASAAATVKDTSTALKASLDEANKIKGD